MLRRAYPASIANRIDPRLSYDVLFVEEAHGALALESDSGLLAAVLSAVERAGLTCGASLREVPGDAAAETGEAHRRREPDRGRDRKASKPGLGRVAALLARARVAPRGRGRLGRGGSTPLDPPQRPF